MNQYRPVPVLKNNASQTVAASATDSAVSEPFVLNPRGAIDGVRVELLISSATVVTAIEAKLQHAVDRDVTPAFEDVDGTEGRVSITAVASPTWFSIRLHPGVAAEAAVMPLRPHGRIVVTTGVGDAVTVTDIRVLREE